MRVSSRPIAGRGMDWLMALGAVWAMTGLFIDGHEHIFSDVESFFSPWHAVMYSGGVFCVVVILVAARRYGAIPEGYRQSLAGVAALLIGGAFDFFWHRAFGFEHQLDLLVSPPHLLLVSGLFFLITGPARSAVARGTQSDRSLFDQLPAMLALGLGIEAIQFIVQSGFYPEILRRDAPLPQSAYGNHQFAYSVLLYYRQALEILVNLWQAILLAAIVTYAALRMRLHFGALIVLCLVEKLWIGSELSRDWIDVAVVAGAAAVAGLAGDLWLRSSIAVHRDTRIRVLAIGVPATYVAASFLWAIPLAGGTWWDASFTFGAIAEAGLAGAAVAQCFIAGRQTGTVAP